MDSSDSSPFPTGDWIWLGRLCARIVHDPGLADDARQEAWLAAARSSDGTPDRRALVRAMRRFVWRFRRSERRRTLRERDVARREPAPATDDVVLRGEQQRRVLEALLALDEPFRSTLLMRYQDGLTPDAIAEALDARVDTVRWRLRRGVEVLRERLGEDSAAGGLAAVALGVPLLARDGGSAGLIGTSGLHSTSFATADAAAGITPTAVTLPIAGIWMFKNLATLAGLLVLVFAGWTALKGTGVDPASTALARAKEQGQPALAGSDEARLADADEVAERRAVALPTIEGAATVPTENARDTNTVSRFVGRVVDERGLGIPRAEVRAIVWQGFDERAVANADGTFQLEVPYDAYASGRVHVTAGELRSRVEFRFGTDRASQEVGPLRPAGRALAAAGEHDPTAIDLGVIELVPCGVVTGRIVDGAGIGIASGWIGASRGATAVEPEHDGSFRIAHVRPGQQHLNVIAREMLDHQRPIDVTAGESLDLGVVALTAGPRVAGRVTDEDGRPLGHAKVSTRGFTRAWVFDVAADGTFDVPMPSTGMRSISARADGFIQHEGFLVEPGANDVVIALASMGALCTFEVVDAKSGAPVEAFGIQVLRGEGSGSPTPAEAAGRYDLTIAPRKGGRVRLRADVALDAVRVVAPGYVEGHTTVTEAATSSVQQVVLAEGPKLTGRVMSNGEAVQGVEVHMITGWGARYRDHSTGALVPVAPEDDRPSLLGGHTRATLLAIDEPLPPVGLSTSWGLERKRTVTDGEGRFHFEDCAKGLYIVASARGDEVATSGVIGVPGRGVHDIGELALVPACTLRGRLAPIPGADLAGSTVRAALPFEVSATTDASGAFELVGLAAGSYVLTVEASPQLYVAPAGAPNGYHVLARHDDARVVEVPLAASPSALVEVTLRHNGAAVDGASVTFRRAGADGADVALVEVGAAGKVGLALPAAEPLSCSVSIHGARIDLPEPRTFGVGHNELALELETGSLTLELPQSFEIDGALQASLGVVDELGEVRAIASIELEPAVRASDDTPRTITFRVVPVGEHRLELVLRTTGGPYDGKEREEALRRAFEVVIARGEATTARL